MATQTQEDGFHEIQLNGKQLVFLFMAATVASVVIFLCGVMVGRGVRAERTQLAQNEVVDEAPTADAVARTPPPMTTVEAVVDPKTPPPDPIEEDLSYGQRLDKPNPSPDKLSAQPPASVAAPKTPPANPKTPPVETGKNASAPAPAKPEKPAAPAPKVSAPPAATSAPALAAAPAPGSGYVVQVAALNVRSEADAIARRLTSKGYSAYVQTPSNGATSVFRVRVGTFKTRREAETVAAKLQKEEQFKPWITR